MDQGEQMDDVEARIRRVTELRQEQERLRELEQALDQALEAQRRARES